MESSPPPSVEFEHQRLAPPPAAPLGRVIDAKDLPGYATRVRVVRAVVVVVGALAVAFATQRGGLPLPTALCVFAGVLPVLWIAGWFGGFVLSARRLAAQARGAVAALGESEADVRRRAHAERVRLEVRDDGLLIERRGELENVARTVPWREVRFSRPGPGGAILQLGPFELLEVPAAAFAEPSAFDAFCLAVQAQVWRAEA
ncbi:MAG: hypothetical protein AB1730_27690 [Myxococcota bacterium]